MYERLGPEDAQETKRGHSVKDDDYLCVGYLRKKEELASQEPEQWKGLNLEDQRWLIAEAILKSHMSAPLMNVQLGYVDMSLADFVPPVYNDQQVARDSDGLQNLNYVA